MTPLINKTDVVCNIIMLKLIKINEIKKKLVAARTFVGGGDDILINAVLSDTNGLLKSTKVL